MFLCVGCVGSICTTLGASSKLDRIFGMPPPAVYYIRDDIRKRGITAAGASQLLSVEPPDSGVRATIISTCYHEVTIRLHCSVTCSSTPHHDDWYVEDG